MKVKFKVCLSFIRYLNISFSYIIFKVVVEDGGVEFNKFEIFLFIYKWNIVI